MARASTNSKKSPAPIQDVEERIAEINAMPIRELQKVWLELYGEPTNTRNRPYLQKRLGFRVQELAEGGLSEQAQEKAAELQGKTPGPRKAKAAEGGESAPTVTRASKRARDERLPKAGTAIKREYKGKTYQMTVHDTDFEYEGKRFSSLSTMAREITGQVWNGYLFWGLTTRVAKKGAA